MQASHREGTSNQLHHHSKNRIEAMNDIGTGQNFPPERPSFLFRSVSYLFISYLIVPVIFIFMKLLNRTRIHGARNLRNLKPPWIVMSNHLTMMDDLFLDPLLMWRWMWRGYSTLPYHAPEERNFYKQAWVAAFMWITKSIPLIRGRGTNQEGMNRLIKAVRDGGTLHIYPEGTRSRTGALGTGKTGTARLAYESGAPVVPVFHRGLEQLLPIGHYVPRILKRIEVVVGEPIYFTEELKLPNNAQTHRMIIKKVMHEIAAQQKKAEQLWGKREFKISDVVLKQMAAKPVEVADPTEKETSIN